VNENRIQQILAYEKKAQEIYEAAVKEADQLPRLAEQEVQAMVARTRIEAEAEARKLIAHSQTDEECARILEQLAEKLNRTSKLAKMNNDRAVDYTLARVIGMEPR
jgi:vacuolar-type H+-ATPase subunit H